MKARPVLNYGLIQAFSLLEACLCLAASSLPPRSCSYLSMTFWFPGLDPWSSGCFCLNSAINSNGLGLGCTLKTPCPSRLRISHCKVHREIQGQKAPPSPNQVSFLCVCMYLFSVCLWSFNYGIPLPSTCCLYWVCFTWILGFADQGDGNRTLWDLCSHQRWPIHRDVGAGR